MKYTLLKETIALLEEFEAVNTQKNAFGNNIEGFKKWICETYAPTHELAEPDWEGKANGRSVESTINTLIVHMNRYAKSYSKSAILGSDFSSQEDFIYLINLKAFGAMSKMALIRKNVHEKPVGMQIINRLARHGWVQQTDSETDKRSKRVCITPSGLQALEQQMGNIRRATQVVTGDLTQAEKIALVRLLTKLDVFHQAIYDRNVEPDELLDEALTYRNR